MGSALSSLKILNLSFSTGTTNDYDDDAEPIAYRTHMERTGPLRTFITSAPLLKSLVQLFCRDLSDIATDFNHFVGNFHMALPDKFPLLSSQD